LTKSFRGRVVLGGELVGESIVTHQGFNILASYMGALSNGNSQCSDQNNIELYKKDLKGKIICLPKNHWFNYRRNDFAKYSKSWNST
jgi:uncharacterized protein